jgi:hypothetical protein
MKKIMISVLSLGFLCTAANYAVPAAVADSVGDWTYAIVGGEVTITEYHGTDAAVTIPAVIDSRPVTAIGAWAFSYHSMTSVVIPNGVVTIGDFAFYFCNALTGVTVPDGVTAIGERAFSFCNAMTSAVLPGSVAAIGADAFNPCRVLTLCGDADSYAEAYANTNEIPFAPLVPLAMSSDYAGKIDARMTRAGDTISLYVKALPNSGAVIGDFTFYAAQYDSGTLVNAAISAGEQAADGSLEYDSVLFGVDCRIFYWDQNMAPIFDAVIPAR